MSWTSEVKSLGRDTSGSRGTPYHARRHNSHTASPRMALVTPLDFLPWIFGYHGTETHLYSRHNILASVLLRTASQGYRVWH